VWYPTERCTVVLFKLHYLLGLFPAHFREGLTRENVHRAFADLEQGAKKSELWMTMAMKDMRQRYRRSILGPFWLTLSMGVFVAALSLLYAGILNQPLDEYLPYVASGFIVWGFTSAMVLDGAQTFTVNEGIIRQLPAPLSIYAYRMVFQSLIIFLHNILIYVVVALLFSIKPGASLLLAFPGLMLLCLNGLWMGLLLGLVSARFRDVPQILASIIQVLFFLTPIIWRPDMLPERAFIVDLNPLYHFIEIVRAPLLGYVPSTETYLITLAITLFGWSTAMLLYTAYRWRIPYWV